MTTTTAKQILLAIILLILFPHVNANADETPVLGEDLKLHIPLLTYQGPDQTTMFWLDLVYVAAVTDQIIFQVENFGIREGIPPSNLTPTLGRDVRLHIPRLRYQVLTFWADLIYVPSDTGAILFQLENFGITDPDVAVVNLPQGWTHDILFKNFFTNPTHMAEDGVGNMYVYDRKDNRLIRLAPDETFEVWATVIDLDSIAYQPDPGRLIGLRGADLYAISPDGTTPIGAFSDGQVASTIIVDSRDGSIYASQWGAGGVIRHFDRNFNLIETLISAEHCLNMALDTKRNILYYADDRDVMALDLGTRQSTVIRENFGDGAESENLGVAVDSSGTVYYSNFYKGLFRYDPFQPPESRETRLMDIPYGFGSIWWWQGGQIILQANVFAGTVVKMDPSKTRAEPLETNVNVRTIVAATTGHVYFYSRQQLYRLAEGVSTAIGPPVEAHFDSIALDHNNQLYYPSDHFLVRVDLETGLPERWITYQDFNVLLMVEYDFTNQQMVALTSATGPQDNEILKIWRAPPQKGANPELVIEIDMEFGAYSAIMVDRERGDIYFFNRAQNSFYRVDEDHQRLVVVRENVIINDIVAPAGVNFFSYLQGFIVTYVDRGRFFLPLDGSEAIVFSEMAYGMDNQRGYEAAYGHYYATNSGVIYRIKPE